ncbi:MAG: hypothetical protein ABF391_00025, partial [Akkermansiaceae bacterium]
PRGRPRHFDAVRLRSPLVLLHNEAKESQFTRIKTGTDESVFEAALSRLRRTTRHHFKSLSRRRIIL